MVGHVHTQAERTQVAAWQEEIEILRGCLTGLEGHVYLEFDVPRLGSRIDAVLVIGPAILPLEFKCGEATYHRADLEQVWDYALDLKNFHRGSHEAPIFPLLVATDASGSDPRYEPPHADGVRPPRRVNADTLRDAIDGAIGLAEGTLLDGRRWGVEPYHPTPTILQAARALYARHTVEDISRHDAGARNLHVTSRTLERIIEEARARGEKAIAFVTGVPGAGKTLVGLNLATRHRRAQDVDPAHAVFLSGNGPLVKVLREALVRDERSRARAAGERVRKGAVVQRVKPFIQNVHHFRDEGLRLPDAPPHDHVVIFDESQRAWDLAKTAKFMRMRKGQVDFKMSEPEVLISYMNRRLDWAVVVCLVGGGQEINEGEAGISAWLDVVRTKYPDWHVHLSSRLTDSEYAAGRALESLRGHGHVVASDELHLAVSMRSFRAEHVSTFVKALLDSDVDSARREFAGFSNAYPLAITRDLERAKRWVREQARGSERYGLVASSQAERLKPHAVDVRVTVDPVQWFLNEATDTRSSYYLEDAATEFQVQGLELDWTCVTWDADLRRESAGWTHRRFRGDRWVRINQPQVCRYLLNAYRVLLTRARQGMVIFVPPGDSRDPTRLPEFYDPTYAYLAELGLREI